MTNCRFTCNVSADWTNEITTVYPDQDTSVSADDYDEDYNEDDVVNSGDGTPIEPETGKVPYKIVILLLIIYFIYM